MHPQIQLPEAGQCPICFMDLIPLESGTGDDAGPRSVVLSASAAALADIRTSVVERKNVAAPVQLVGRVTYDERLVRTVASRVAGRIDTLFVDFTGTSVVVGEPLASLYSPELYTAQAELLSALRAEQEMADSPDAGQRAAARATVESVRRRLELWGLESSQVESVVRGGQAADHVRILSPLTGAVVHKDAVEGLYVKTGTRIYTVADLSRVWVTLSAYEKDLPLLAEGQTVDFDVPALPGARFSAVIAFIDPVLDAETRTVTVRLDVENDDGRLKPGMYVNAIAGAGGGSDGETPLVIPATAPLITGRRAVVYVRLPGHAKATFAGREVVLGPRRGDYYEVVSGLAAGDSVVTRGAFKIDSALQIQAKPSMMSPPDGPLAAAPASLSAPASPGPLPAGFRDDLGAVLQTYLDVQAAMAADDSAAARSASAAVVRALDAIDTTALDDTARAAWTDGSAALESAVAAMAEADDFEQRRADLRPVTAALWPLLDRFGYRDDDPVRLFHCPMANDNQGADWIQRAATTVNPYYGSMMLRCGSQIDSLAAPSAGDGSAR